MYNRMTSLLGLLFVIVLLATGCSTMPAAINGPDITAVYFDLSKDNQETLDELAGYRISLDNISREITFMAFSGIITQDHIPELEQLYDGIYYEISYAESLMFHGNHERSKDLAKRIQDRLIVLVEWIDKRYEDYKPEAPKQEV